MASRNTSTGRILEEMILPALLRGGYVVSTQVDIGQRLGSGRHIVDAVAERAGVRHLISLKWQQVSGTAEQKVPFEVISLVEALSRKEYGGAYLVLGGEGWKLRHFYTDGGLADFIVGARAVQIVTLESFVARANQGAL